MKSLINLEDGSDLTDISPVLTCIHTLNESGVWHDFQSKGLKSLSLKQLRGETEISREDGFCFAVSLRDGSCLYTSNAITDHLGYPKDMLVGQCMMNFLFQKDHITFTNHLTQGLNACFIQGKRDDSHLVLNTFFCRLRVYHSLKSGYSVSDRKTQYRPFKITLHINELIFDDLCVEKPSGTLCVKATATQVSSAYSIPEEIPAMTSFSTRHTASCHFSHVDASAIPYLGYLPQDMIGYSVFDFYHMGDLLQLKDIYELVVKEQGTSFRSKPYRLKVHNGCYILLETEWSCFINPWSHKLEFVVGQHRVLRGPSDINIFTPEEIVECTLADEMLKECQTIKNEIKTLLSASIQFYEEKKAKRFCNKRKRDLATFVYNCIDEGLKGNKLKNIADKQFETMDDKSNSDLDSVVMGDISPYREVNDTSISSETPPTVQQLRYQENIERFFASQPKTYSDGSDEYNKNEKILSADDSQGSSSGSGNGSGKDTSKGTRSLQQTVNSYEDNKKSGNNSSKGNMSSITTGDSGYGKSLEKDHSNDPSVSQAGSSTQVREMRVKNSSTDCMNSNMEKFSPCLALTEESLSVHNRMSHKQFKQQRKNKTSAAATTQNDANWFQQKDSGHAKGKRNIFTVSTLTQTDDIMKTGEQSKMDFLQEANKEQNPAKDNSTSTHPFLFPPMNCTPTPFYIPVMYMGSMPYYPPTSTGGQMPWPFAPFPNFGASSEKPESAATKTENVPEFLPTTTNSIGKTTTTLTNSKIPSFQNSLNKGRVFETKNEKRLMKVNNRKTQSDSNDSEMLVEESQSSSFTQSSSYESSADKEEDMDFEMKKCHPVPRSDKMELTSDVAFRYQMSVTSLEDVLKKDMEFLKGMQQPDMVNQQLKMLLGEQVLANECELKVDDSDSCMTEEAMLGLTMEDNVSEELEYHEERLLGLMCDD